jgi:hypothetical protein
VIHIRTVRALAGREYEHPEGTVNHELADDDYGQALAATSSTAEVLGYPDGAVATDDEGLWIAFVYEEELGRMRIRFRPFAKEMLTKIVPDWKEEP